MSCFCVGRSLFYFVCPLGNVVVPVLAGGSTPVMHLHQGFKPQVPVCLRLSSLSDHHVFPGIFFGSEDLTLRSRGVQLFPFGTVEPAFCVSFWSSNQSIFAKIKGCLQSWWGISLKDEWTEKPMFILPSGRSKPVCWKRGIIEKWQREV